MKKNIIHLFCILSQLLILTRCDSTQKNESSNFNDTIKVNKSDTLSFLTEVQPILCDQFVNAAIEIPAGTVEKWEVNKLNGKLKFEYINNKPRIIDYIGYPGNYGMIPKTLLSEKNGGDGDPLDILVLGPPVKRGEIEKCKIIGVLYLLDHNENDDKIIAVSKNSSMYQINSLEELKQNYKGVTEIIQLWFTNYKGAGKMESKGYGSKKNAIHILEKAIAEYKTNHDIEAY